ncbi:sensor histidine kinase [Aquimarina sp. 2201CG5-10]|uniref:sensor histidine kinase n=1 Tax=Aquimarina callyspongiae TaxID=3098150 RepID=UPI002AB389C7|nr:sensor histidine kinase [Aquimarina sp. 2201CG5-10]MDY8136007.1 sensor histidine kinase [Aquimarina sp. 2201CG5-10]
MVKRKNWIDWILQNRVVSHLIFWVLVFISLPILAALNEGSVKKTVMSSFAYLPAQLSASYFLVYYQVPKLLFKKKYLRFGFSLLISTYMLLVLSKLLSMNLTKLFAPKYFEEKSLIEIISDPFHLAVVYFPSVYVFVFLMFMIKAFKDRFEERHQLEVLQKEKVNTELKFLKAQINPHFLFNTLNNLYSLTLEESAEKSSEVVLKLSDMLDYMLYQCKDPEVPLKNEITFIQDYIDLESLRYGDKLTLQFTHQLHDPHVMIAPLILISFVENAFKHGASNTLEDSTITIELTTNQEQLCFKVFNTLPPGEEDDTENESNSGIGFSNSKRQLELNYINNYDLKSTQTDNDFQIVLTINLH